MPESGICTITVDGKQLLGVAGLPLIEFLAGNGIDLPHICYHKTLGALQTCDTCWVEVNGELRRGCTLKAEDGLVVDLDGDNASNARREGIDRIVARHELYCSVCENNNGDCRVHNVVRQMDVPYQRYPFRPKPYAIDDSHPMYRYDPKTKTVCTFCGVGCAFELWTRGRKILKVQPVEEAPVNGISTCIKGKFGWDFVNSKDRLTMPLIRENGCFREAEWEEAYALIARRFTEIRDQYGPDAMMFVASSKCTNEESCLMQKLARAVIGTNNIDNCSRYCQSPATQGLWRTMGYGGDGGSISDLEQAEVILFLGSNTAESHPVLATRLKQAHKHRGQKHIVFDLRRHEMAERTDVFLRPKPGIDLIWLSAISKYILDNGLEDKAFLKEKVKHLEEYRKSLEPFTMEYAEEMTGIAANRLEEVAKTLASAKTVCAVWAMGVTQHVAGSDTSTAIANLLLVTGNSARRGTGAYPMRGHNNVQGCSDFGPMPERFPGYEFVSDDEVRARYENSWGG